MMMKNEMDKVIQRTYRYGYEDGLWEIATGCMIVVCGLLLLVVDSVPPGAPLASVLAVGFTILVQFFGWLAVGRAVKALKTRITYPRTGYVSYRRPEGTRRRWLIVAGGGGAFGALFGVLLAVHAPALVVISIVEGLFIGASLLYLGYRLGLARFYVLAFLSASIGVVTALSGLDGLIVLAAYFGEMGLVLTASGLFTLRAYLSQTQPPVEERA
jgi:hypothetical protein